MAFVHLHVHSQYSLLDGQASIPRLVEKALADGQPGIALTDHGNMMGVKELHDYVAQLRSKAAAELEAAQEKLVALEAADGQPESDQGGQTAPSCDGRSREQLLLDTRREITRSRRRAAFMPIFGCEMYVARRGDKALRETKEDLSGWHLIVLAKNEQGYHNLIKLVSRAWVDGFYGRPRTDHHELETYRQGLIICSACIGGEVPQKILAGREPDAEQSILWFKERWGDDYYLELQRHEVTDPAQRANRETYPLQQEVNAVLLRMARKHGIKLVCTNDVHFVDEENAEAHDRLICLSTGRKLDDPARMLYTKQEWFKTEREMSRIFPDLPEALENTLEVLSKVEYYTVNHPPIMPNFPIPEAFGSEQEVRERISREQLFQEFTCDEHGEQVLTREQAEDKIKKLGGIDKLYRIKFEADYLASLTWQGARRRYGDPVPADVAERIKFELHIMKTMGFPGYFLIVWDYIRAAREELDVSVGPGRGSAAGSAVAYCLGITQVDPIKYDLLFERFLNPDRISLPDIDVDFDDDGRGKVLQWVTRKYGAENVAHIITYGTMATKSVLADVARVEQLPLAESRALTKLIPDKLPEGPDGKAPKLNLANCIAAIPKLREAEASTNPLVHDTLRYAKMLEGNIRSTGVHACGFIICRDKISDWVPVSTAQDKDTRETINCTQFEGRVIEDTGLIKMDFLGLKTLSIIREAVANIRDSLGIEIDIDSIPIDDPATYRLYQDGATIGTFQFESTGMQRYLRELQPTSFEDLIAMNALYRPGPMQYIPQFIKRKHGEEPITYDLPCMERYLRDTYGITVYQEQVMLLSREIAGFTRGESDALRKAMGKKIIAKLNHMYPKFIAGGKAAGYDPKTLEKIWDDWRAFASYAFNKSHATCYSWVAYQTAWLKANFPAQYMAGVMSRNLADKTTITKLMDECKAMNIRTLGPDINESRLKFFVTGQSNIRFGLGAISGVGEGAVAEIEAKREKGGPFKSVYDFVERIDFTKCNRKCIESLAGAGAFDSFQQFRREEYLAPSPGAASFIEVLMRYGQHISAERASMQNSLFGSLSAVEVQKPLPPTGVVAWSQLEKLNLERELLGIFISGHPLDPHRLVLQKLCNVTMPEVDQCEGLPQGEITFGGIVTSVRRGQSKKNGLPYGIPKIEDFAGAGELPLWSDDWAKWNGYFEPGNAVFITARVEPRRWSGELSVRVSTVEFLSNVNQSRIHSISLTLRADALSEIFVTDLLALIQASDDTATQTGRAPGTTEDQKGVQLLITLSDPEHQISVPLRSTLHTLHITPQLLDFLDANDVSYSVNK